MTILNILIYISIIFYWLTNLHYNIFQHINNLVISNFYNYDNDNDNDNDDSFGGNYLLIVNLILFLLSYDTNIYYLILVSIYFVNVIEFYIKKKLYEYIFSKFEYLLMLFLHLILLYFLCDNTSYMSSLIYMTSCLIIGIM